MGVIELTKGQYCIVDDADFNSLKKYSWHVRCDRDGRYYATRSFWEGDKMKTLPMHRQLLDAPKGVYVDHINGNTLDNRRSNLRLCTNRQNTQNARKRARTGSKSKYKGVSEHYGKWRARIRVDGAVIHLGSFLNQVDAAKAYDKAAAKYFGEFARLNLPRGAK